MSIPKLDIKVEKISIKKSKLEKVMDHIKSVEEVLSEMESINPRMAPIQGHTKDRWVAVLRDCCGSIQRLIGRSLTAE